ncbi:unnamed protein product [Diabrotica balteata]|uniref:Uncharacterized protein n=1 Tax=Diabrotica balteata TaxID=107213 RepID=A0A9N9TCT2_DIABA|nr:unnamed protein product [Diabrotica balteata]
MIVTAHNPPGIPVQHLDETSGISSTKRSRRKQGNQKEWTRNKAMMAREKGSSYFSKQRVKNKGFIGYKKRPTRVLGSPRKGLWFCINKIVSLEVNINRYEIGNGSSYIKLTESIQKKRACIKVWIDLKNKVKKKDSVIRNSRTQTGGGPPLKGILTDLEERIIRIIGDTAIYGLSSSRDDPLDSEDVNEPSETVDVNYDHEASSSTITAGVSDSEPDTPENPRKRRLLSAGSSSSYYEVSPRATKSRKVHPATSAAQAATRFAEIGEELNQRMESIDQKLEQLIEEKKRN